MLEVVFSDSAKGAMAAAQHWEIDPACLSVFSNEPLSPQEEKRIREKAEREWAQRKADAVPLGGGREDIFGLSFFLSMGDVASPLESGPRQELIMRMLTADPWGWRVPEADAEKFWRGCLNDLHKLKCRAETGEPVRIWYDSSPDGMCGLLFAASELKNACRLSSVRLPEWEEKDDGIVHHTSWAETVPEEFSSHLGLEKELTKSVRNVLAMWWERLKGENAPLRASVNGYFQSVGERFYDGFIRAAAPEGEFTVAKLIGRTLGKYQLGVGDWLVSQRIAALVKEGAFTVVKSDGRPYATVLRAE